MKLDANVLRYMTKEEFRVLTAVEMGMKNHEIVPVELIDRIAGLKRGGAFKNMRVLLKHKLLHHDQQKYDGYRLTPMGYDYLALKTFLARGVISGLGRVIGIGKESDVHEVVNDDGETLCIKFHRLGRTSFRAVKNKRDYLKHRQSFNWLYLSRLAALKEFAFMKALGDHGFAVPQAIEWNRHCVLMTLVPGYPLVQVKQLQNPAHVYRQSMDFIVRLAEHGLIHCDFNEFNLMVDDEENLTMIDFPQMVSVQHANARMYFERDVNCIRKFFAKRYNYQLDDEGQLAEAADLDDNDAEQPEVRESEAVLRGSAPEGKAKLMPNDIADAGRQSDQPGAQGTQRAVSANPKALASSAEQMRENAKGGAHSGDEGHASREASREEADLGEDADETSKADGVCTAWMGWPRFDDVVANVGLLDRQLEASGYTPEVRDAMEEYVASVGQGLGDGPGGGSRRRPGGGDGHGEESGDEVEEEEEEEEEEDEEEEDRVEGERRGEEGACAGGDDSDGSDEGQEKHGEEEEEEEEEDAGGKKGGRRRNKGTGKGWVVARVTDATGCAAAVGGSLSSGSRDGPDACDASPGGGDPDGPNELCRDGEGEGELLDDGDGEGEVGRGALATGVSAAYVRQQINRQRKSAQSGGGGRRAGGGSRNASKDRTGIRKGKHGQSKPNPNAFF
eukprot:jgi/Mesvir1/10111/Mv06980-RA.1